MRHQNCRIVGLQRMHRSSGRDDTFCLWKPLSPGELGSAISDRNAPPHVGGHADERLGILSGTEDKEALGSAKFFDKSSFVDLAGLQCSRAGKLRFREAFAREERSPIQRKDRSSKTATFAREEADDPHSLAAQ
jgi:hypothetical protein